MGPQKFCYTFFHYNTCFLGSFRPIACRIGSLSSVIWLYHVKWGLGVECEQSGALWNDSGRDKRPKNMVSVKCICSWEMRHKANDASSWWLNDCMMAWLHEICLVYLLLQLFARKWWFSIFFTKPSPTDGRTDGPTDRRTNRPTDQPTDGQGLL